MPAAPRTLPYEATIHARTCRCDQPPFRIGRFQKEETAVRVISGYWNIYLGFFGDQLVWLHFQVVDVRTGLVVWHNGRATTPGREPNDLITS